MTHSARSFLLDMTRVHRSLGMGLVVFVGTFLGYAAGFFYHSGGVVFIPYHAAVVGMLAALWVGYRRDGLVFGWVVTYMSLLGSHADHAFLGISHRSIEHRIAYFLRPDGLVALAVEGIILGTLAFGFGYLLRSGIRIVRRRSGPPSEN